LEDEGADGGIPVFGGGANPSGLFGRAAQEHCGSDRGRWRALRQEARERFLVAKGGENFLVDGHHAHHDVQDIATDRAAFKRGMVANFSKVLFRAVDEQGCAVRHDGGRISVDINDSNWEKP
jgi:hypothetical protein